LAKKIGQALVKSHQYNKAINYYIAALKSGQQYLLRYDLAELYNRLNQLDNAEKIISETLADNSKQFFHVVICSFTCLTNEVLNCLDNDTEYIGMVAKCYYLSYEINLKKNKTDLLLQCLEKAKEFQLKGIKKANLDNADLLDDYNNMLSKIHKKYFEYYTNLKDHDSAEKALKEAILQNESDIDVRQS
jgi:tetratricopeptide repeat protein 21B